MVGHMPTWKALHEDTIRHKPGTVTSRRARIDNQRPMFMTRDHCVFASLALELPLCPRSLKIKYRRTKASVSKSKVGGHGGVALHVSGHGRHPCRPNVRYRRVCREGDAYTCNAMLHSTVDPCPCSGRAASSRPGTRLTSEGRPILGREPDSVPEHPAKGWSGSVGMTRRNE